MTEIRRLIDVIPRPETDPASVETASAIARRIDQAPMVFPILEPHIVGIPVVCFELLVTAVATYEDVGRNWLLSLGSMPPFTLIDLKGIDHSHDVLTRMAASEDEGAKADRELPPRALHLRGETRLQERKRVLLVPRPRVRAGTGSSSGACGTGGPYHDGGGLSLRSRTVRTGRSRQT